MMIPESIQSLLKAIQDRDIRVVVGGGLAVNHHGFARLTTDADFIVCGDDRAQLEDVFEGLKFSKNGETAVSTRYTHASYVVPNVDLLWTERGTFEIFWGAVNGADDSEPFLTLPHLLAMKIHAIAQNKDRLAKDSEDIRYLLKQNPTAISLEDYQKQLNRFATEDLKEYLRALHPNS